MSDQKLGSLMLLKLLVLLIFSFSVMAENKEDILLPPLPKEIENDANKADLPLPLTKEDFSWKDDNYNIPRTLNALELSGYFRTRFTYFRNPHLSTYIPDLGRGTSMIPPNISVFNKNEDKDDGKQAKKPSNNFSGNMRLRLNPTIHVSEVVRISSSIDLFDNLILGSTPNYLSSTYPNPSWPSSLMSLSQNTPSKNINSWQDAMALKRAFGEVNFPIGDLRFGRMPIHFGLGILYNSGDDISNDYGDNIDGVSFTTRIFDHFISPSYSIAYVGPHGRGGGFFNHGDHPSSFLPAELGQRYPLESGDMTHVFSLSFVKKASDHIMHKKQSLYMAIYHYGIFASYRRQFLDSQVYGHQGGKLSDVAKNIVKRNSHVGLLSLWQHFMWGTFALEIEMAGILGKYEIGNSDNDLMAKNSDLKKRNIYLLQGGLALQSKYGFLNDRLQVGLDGGLASSQGGPGFGIREGSNNNPKPGDADGVKLPSDNNYKTNFKFNPAFYVDLLLFREILGGISGAYYIKPHISYFFSRNFGMRGDVITSLALNKSNTTGDSHWLGVEMDASAFLRSDNGFYWQLAYGLLLPLKGLNHHRDHITPQQYNLYGEASMAQTIQTFLGITF